MPPVEPHVQDIRIGDPVFGKDLMRPAGDAIAAAHLAEVNGWTPQVAAVYIDQAFAVWEERFARAWSLDVSALTAYGIDPAIIAEANGTSAQDRLQGAAATTAEVRSSEVRLIPQSELDSYIDHLMYEL
jgi:hypothetical protein